MPRVRTSPSAPSAWSDRITGTGHESPAALIANPANWRTHPPAQAAALSAVLDEVGWVTQVIVNRTSGHLVDGHLRVALALERQETQVPVCYVELSEEEEALVLASLDPIGAMAVADQEKLQALLGSFEVSDQALSAMLAELVSQATFTLPPDPDELPVPGEPRTHPGELWRIGPHTLLCADARDPSSWDRLLEGSLVDLVLTDPPYGVDYVGKTKRALRIEGDSQDEAALEALLSSVLSQARAHSRPGACWYVCAPAGEGADVFAAVLRSLGVRRHCVVWVKDAFVLGRADFHYRHELLYYGWVPGASHRAPPSRDQDSVWEIPRPRQSPDHPTQKPLALMARAIANSSIPGERVLDPFAGSGTSLLAAAASGRIGLGIEIDPRYCDVALTRLEGFLQQEARQDG